MDREQLQRENIVRIFQLSNGIQTYIDRLLKPLKLTTKQFFMMIILGSFGYHPRVGEISDRFGTSRQNAKQVLMKLQKSGYITLYKDENDQRIVRAAMTEKAQSFWSKRDVEDSNSMSMIFEVLSDEELISLLNGLQKVTQKVEGMNQL